MDAATFKAAVEATPKRFPAAEPDPICGDEPVRTRVTGTPAIRAEAKAAQWARAIQQNWAERAARAATPEQQAHLEALLERTLKEGPDFAKVRSNATFAPIPVVAYSKSVAREIMRQAREIERETYPARAKGEHGGALGRMALDLLEWFCFIMWPMARYGMTPSLTYIAKSARMSRTTVVEAMKPLERFGFLRIQHRRGRVEASLGGAKVVQWTNAYVLGLAKGLGELALAVFEKKRNISVEKSSDFSESKSWPAKRNESLPPMPPLKNCPPKAPHRRILT